MMLDAFTRLLETHCPPALVRAAATDPAALAPLARALEDSGFALALVPEPEGAGLTLAAFAPLVLACGAHLLPLPFPEDAIARVHGPATPESTAALNAAKMAGALQRLLDLSLAHLSTREQFGRPLARFQVLQHLVAQMAEEVAAATLAAHIGLSGGDGAGPAFAPERSAAAFLRTAEAARLVAAAAHQLHGALGATAEFDLQLYTTALQSWAREAGPASHWAETLARHRLAARAPDSAAYIRTHLQPQDSAA
jgi:hypothetical protein